MVSDEVALTEVRIYMLILLEFVYNWKGSTQYKRVTDLVINSDSQHLGLSYRKTLLVAIRE